MAIRLTEDERTTLRKLLRAIESKRIYGVESVAGVTIGLLLLERCVAYSLENDEVSHGFVAD